MVQANVGEQFQPICRAEGIILKVETPAPSKTLRILSAACVFAASTTHSFTL